MEPPIPPQLPDDGALARTIAFEQWLNEATADRSELTAHGRVCTSRSFPRRYDSNFLWVVDTGPEVTAEILDAEVGAALEGFEHRQILVNDDEAGERLSPGFAELGYEATRLVVMRHLHPPDREPTVPVTRVSFAEGEQLFLTSNRREPSATDDDLVQSLVAWRRRLEERAGATFFVGTLEGAQAGGCEVYRHDGVAMVEDVFTLEEFQGRGVARAVVVAAVRAAREDGADLVFLHAVADGWPRGLYAKLGFEPIGHVWTFLRSPAPIAR